MSFVRLENLNDFIQPGTTCIKPVEKKANGVVAKVNDISLSDCLACSGCITSAETVLVQQQNYEELFKVINENKIVNHKKEIVVSLSLQSISSLAYRYSIGAQEAAERLASFFISIGCTKICDINLARHLSLIESYKEFKSKLARSSKPPLISSICPGWVCYAEKTNGDLIIPHLSRVRSPQQIMGALLKRTLSKQQGMSGNDVFHVTLMPCFDKKLEASRENFRASDDSQDVDCVLTPVELEEILSGEGVTLLDFERRRLDTLLISGDRFDEPLTSHIGSGSGGYAENILLAQAHELTGQSFDKLRRLLEYSSPKNSDFIELNLKRLVDEPELDLPKFAIVNGFRNIQTIVQRLKRKALKYDYIEIMACPSGCLNGGAQCRPNDGHDQPEALKSTKSVYEAIPTVDMETNEATSQRIYDQLGARDTKDDLVYTDFHAVPKMQNLSVNW